MSDRPEHPESAYSAEDHENGQSTSRLTTRRERNAFTELMSKKPNPTPKSKPPQSKAARRASLLRRYIGREALVAYVKDPEAFFPSSEEPGVSLPVIYYNEEWLLIKDLYPKSAVHLLLIPRHPKFYSRFPVSFLQDPSFLASAKAEVIKATEVAASELRRLFGQNSAADRARKEAMEAEEVIQYDKLPAGRDWSKEIMNGVHCNPSMNHVHIHILSKDRCSEKMKKMNHYNSFNTRFLAPLEDFPLAEDDIRMDSKQVGQLLRTDMTCWRCGKNFGQKFAQLKEHLEEEFEKWKRE